MALPSIASTGFAESLSALSISASVEEYTVPFQSFTLFPNLPTELRLKIWSQALNDLPGRILILQEISPGSKHVPARFFCKRPVPTLAYVCHEASSLIRSYNHLFKDGTSHTQICFDADKDTILLGPQFRVKQLKRLENSMREGIKLKSLAIEFAFTRRYNNLAGERFDHQPVGWGMWEVGRIFDAFPALGRLVFVPQHDFSDERSHSFGGEVMFQWPKRSDWWQQEWEVYVRWAREEYEHAWSRWRPGMKTPAVEFMGLGLVGGEMVRRWDRVRKRSFWVLAAEAEDEEQPLMAKAFEGPTPLVGKA